MANELKKKEEGTVAMLADFEADAGLGMEAVDSDCTAIPFIRILQKLSPQCEPSDGKYIEGAKDGMLLNTVTEEVMDGDAGITFVPVLFNRRIIEWEGTESGSGLVGIHNLAEGLALMKDAKRDDKNNDVLPNGHCLVDAREHYGLVIKEDGTSYPALISMTKSQLKISKRWVSRIMGIRLQGTKGPFNPPAFSHMYKLTTIVERNRDNKPYSNWKVELIGRVDDPNIVAEARMFLDGLNAGAVQVDHNQMSNGSEEAAEGGNAGANDNTPF